MRTCSAGTLESYIRDASPAAKMSKSRENETSGRKPSNSPDRRPSSCCCKRNDNTSQSTTEESSENTITSSTTAKQPKDTITRNTTVSQSKDTKAVDTGVDHSNDSIVTLTVNGPDTINDFPAGVKPIFTNESRDNITSGAARNEDTRPTETTHVDTVVSQSGTTTATKSAKQPAAITSTAKDLSTNAEPFIISQSEDKDSCAEHQGITASPGVYECQCTDMPRVGRLSPDGKKLTPKHCHVSIPGHGPEAGDYSCWSCKKGHRAPLCKHTDRPLVRVNGPGRPKGTKRKKGNVPGRDRECDCPVRTCTCSGKCDCVPQCFCTRKSYIIIYISGPTEKPNERPSFTQDMTGRFEIQRETWIDLKGNEIPPTEAQRLQVTKAQLLERETRSGLQTPTAPSTVNFQHMSPAAFNNQKTSPANLSTPILSGKPPPFVTPNLDELVTFDYGSNLGSAEPTTDLAFDSVPLGLGDHTQQFPQEPALFAQDNSFGFPPYDPNYLPTQLDPVLEPVNLFDHSSFGNLTASTRFSAALPDLDLPQMPMGPADCCSHRNIATETASQFRNEGCNCGEVCTCFACTQHIMNATTMNAVSQSHSHMYRQHMQGDRFALLDTPADASSCTGAFQMAYAQTNLENATFGEYAPEFAQTMVTFQLDEESNVYGRSMHTRVGKGWATQQPFQEMYPDI